MSQLFQDSGVDVPKSSNHKLIAAAHAADCLGESESGFANQAQNSNPLIRGDFWEQVGKFFKVQADCIVTGNPPAR